MVTTDSIINVNLLSLSEGFRNTINGRHTNLFVLKNNQNMQVAVTNFGARIVSILVPCKNGKLIDVIVGPDSLEGFLKSKEAFFGAIIGRFGNRISNGKFTINGNNYSLDKNIGSHHLHGGKNGFHNVVWEAHKVSDQLVEFKYLSKDNEEGYPGNLQVTVSYSLTDSNELKINYVATTEKPTIVNLTSHGFFNLNGCGSGKIDNHTIMINADGFTLVNADVITTGEIQKVEGTPFDFRNATRIGQRLEEEDIQLKYGSGYDHNFVLNKKQGQTMQLAAKTQGDLTKIIMEVYTEEPGMQFYGGNFLQGVNKIKQGNTDNFRTAFCLETQHFPNSPNHSHFPSVLLNPGQVYSTSTSYKFSAE